MAKQKGFTLVELLITLGVVGIVFSSALPSFSAVINNNRADSTLNTVITLFSLARSRAVLSNQIVTICPTRDYINCSGDWAHSLMVFTDKDNSKSINDDDQLVHTYRPQDNQVVLLVHPSRKRYFQYSATGLSHGTPGNIVFCPEAGDIRFARQIVISFTGRIRVSRDKNNDGIVDDTRGRTLSCT